MAYNVRRIRHVCSVKGCSNRDVILIAKNGQIGGVYLCEECAKKAFEVFSEARKKKVKRVVEEAVKTEAAAEESVAGEDEVKAPKRVSKKTISVPKDGD